MYFVLLMLLGPFFFCKNSALKQSFFCLAMLKFVFFMKSSMSVLLVASLFVFEEVNFILIFLVVWLFLLVVISAGSESTQFYLHLLTLQMILVMSFMTPNLFIFFIFFEASLLPTLCLILGWGYQPERLQAGVFMLLYTLFASLPLLLFIFFLKEKEGTLNLILLTTQSNFLLNFFWFFLASLAFLVKLPVFILHLWLPKAHVEAPVIGSMILAGLLLKLGGYGFLMIMKIFQSSILTLSWVYLSFVLWGGVLASFLCLRQTDLKSLIALSSVAHMSLVLSAMFSFTKFGVKGSVLMMIGHGFCSSALFYIAYLTSRRSQSRSVFLNKGMSQHFSIFSLLWFMLVAANMSAPPTLTLASEVFMIIATTSFSYFSCYFSFFLVFLAGAYSVYLYKMTQHGKPSFILPFSSEKMKELLVLLMHWLPLNFMIFYLLLI